MLKVRLLNNKKNKRRETILSPVNYKSSLLFKECNEKLLGTSFQENKRS